MVDDRRIDHVPENESDADEKILVPAEEVSGDEMSSAEILENITKTQAISRDEVEIESNRPVIDLGASISASPNKGAVPVADNKVEESLEKGRRHLKISCHKCSQKMDVTFLDPFSRFDCPSCGEELIVPKWFDNYLLEEPGGSGGMATVYRGLDLALDREVAIKVLKQEVADKRESSDLFLHEARTSATINHYAVIPIYTCGEYNNQPYIIMQYMAGGSLETKLKIDRELPADDVVHWIRDCAEGLDNARRHGIIHHDIKPGNIMLDNEGNAKIGDFGIAQALNDSRNEEIERMTTAWISPHYVSPEKVMTGREDFRGDIYSLGASFYNLITGKTPFDKEDMDELIRMRLKEAPPSPRIHRPEISQEISRLIMSMLERDPQLRPGYREIIKVLNGYLKSRGKVTKRSKISQGMNDQQKSRLSLENSLPKTEPDTQPQKKSEPDKNKKLSPLKLVLIVGLAIVGILSGIIISSLVIGSWNAEPLPENFHPEITGAFADGNPKLAQELAMKAMNETASPESRGQAGLNLSFAYYLNAQLRSPENCSFIYERLAAADIDETNAVMALIKFLEDEKISPETLRMRLKTEGRKKVLGSLAILVRHLYNNASPETVNKAFHDLYQHSSTIPGEYWGNPWRKRLPVWEKALSGQAVGKETIEPLFTAWLSNRTTDDGNGLSAGKESSLQPSASQFDPGKINVDWLRKHREFAINRPIPVNFQIPENKLTAYLKKLPALKRDKEAKRYQEITLLGSKLKSMLLRIPYKADDIELSTGQSLKGTLSIMGGKLILTGKNGERPLEWKKLSFRQITRLIAHYADARSEAADTGRINIGGGRKQAADDYLNLAILCDWYGKYPLAARFIRKACEVDPGITEKAAVYFKE